MKRYCLILAALLLAATSAEARTDTTPRNAADFGFRPTASAEENARALQKALDMRGTIQITEPGIYDLCNTMLIGSNTTLEFGAGVQIRKQTNRKGESATYVFINRGAFTKTYDENIRIEGLSLICNGLDSGNDVDKVIGMMGHLSFYYVKHLAIDRFTTLDGTPHTYAIQVCSFEDLSVTGARIEGMKDAVHLCRGNKFVIRDCIFKTYDDPLAFNAHDYLLSVPELGWIEDGVVENCYDLADPENGTTGFFCRILAGAWTDWTPGMEVRVGDAVVSEGRLYRVHAPYDGKVMVSTVQPTFKEGIETLADGVKWVMLQDNDVEYTCGCRNIHFKDIFLQKPRQIAFQLHFDRDKYSRSYYPGARPPVQENIIFENIYIQAPITTLIKAKTPINNIKVINSMLNGSEIFLYDMKEGLHYDTTHILMSGTTFKGDGEQCIVRVSPTRKADLRVIGSVVEGKEFKAVTRNVEVLSSDIEIEQKKSEYEPL